MSKLYTPTGADYVASAIQLLPTPSCPNTQMLLQSSWQTAPPPNYPAFGNTLRANDQIWSTGNAFGLDRLAFRPIYLSISIATRSDLSDAVSITIPLWWNNQNAWSGLAAIATPLGPGLNSGGWPNAGAAFPPAWVAGMPPGWTGGTATFTGALGQQPLFTGRPDIKQLIIGVNAVALPAAIGPDCWVYQDNTTQAPQYYIAYGLRILEYDAFLSRLPAPLAQSPFFYPGDSAITFLDGGQAQRLPCLGGPSSILYISRLQPPSSTPVAGYTWSNTASPYVVQAQAIPDPTWQAPSLVPLPAWPGFYVLANNGRVILPGAGAPYNGLDCSGINFIQNASLVIGSQVTPTVQIPMKGGKNYSFYMSQGQLVTS